jgi:hypothetical protein
VLPVPFLPVALLEILDLSNAASATSADSDFAIRLPIIAFWFASTLGYFATRMFPTRAELLYQELKRSSLAQRLGERFFPLLLRAAFDPAVPLHYKIAYEGIYCMPLPWFALVNGLLIPSVLYGIFSAWRWAWFALAPHHVFNIASELALPWMLIMLAIGLVRRNQVKIYHAKKTQDSLLQHS